MTPTTKQIASYHYSHGMRCNCDLDNWEPTATTGHSEVCRIHKAATARSHDMPADLIGKVSAWLETTHDHDRKPDEEQAGTGAQP